jgi:signal transduction histidine kinase/CheY-like chemotaxis protein/HPt (histidine-containing phosphotransfer) domain-containing protein
MACLPISTSWMLHEATEPTDKDSLLQQALDRIQYRIGWLSKTSQDSSEVESFSKIDDNVRELLIGYAGLEEIRYNLANQNFSDKALKTIETKIQRREELQDLDFLQGIQNRRFFSEVIPKIENQQRREDLFKKNRDFFNLNTITQDELLDIAKNLDEWNRVDSTSSIQKASSDSLLVAMRKVVMDIYRDEQQLRNNFIDLEERLSAKNKEIFSEIQMLVSSMQRNLLTEYKEQNQSAYQLTYRVTNILAFLVFLGVIGSLGFVYSILMEVRKANSYQARLEEAKQHSDHLAKAKQDFLANMSHEIRNPLHAIQGYQNALGKSKLNSDQKEFVEMIGFASDTLMGIVNDILDFSKLEAGKLHIEQATFDPLKLFTAIKGFYAFKAEEKKLGFHWQIDLPDDKWMYGDQLRINQIMNNLLSNAFKFTHQGEIEVTVRYHEPDRLEMKIRDTGMGMTEEVRRTIFQEFNQGDTSVTRKFGGTGLGLAIVKRLVDMQGGIIQVNSEYEKGTEVSVELPIKLTEPAYTPDAKNVDYTFSLAGLHLLVVDDDPIGIRFIRLLLESHGAKVTSYRGGLDFKVNFRPELFDMAILDIQMPEISGFKVLEMLKKYPALHKIPVLAMTANVFVDEKHKLIESGFHDLILKPFKEDQIVLKIGEILELPKLYMSVSDPSSDLSGSAYNLIDLKKFCMEDEELLQDIIYDFVNITSKNLRSLEQALLTSDYKAIMGICHQLSSRLAQIKVPASEKAKQIEVSIKNNDNNGINEKVKSLIEECGVVVEKLALDFQLEVPS